MSCSCIYCDTNEESYALETIVEAIDERKCGECNRKIEKLEKYTHIRYWDENWCEECDDYVCECSCVPYDTLHCICVDCGSIITTFYCEGFYFYQVIERLQDHVWDVGDNVLSCDMRKLTKRARDMLCDLVEEYWADEEERG